MSPKHPRALRGLSTLAVLTALATLSGGSLSAQTFVQTPVSCPLLGTATVAATDGFYVTGYSGNNLGQVTLGYNAPGATRYNISLTAHRNTYDGPIIGTTQIATVNMPAASGETLVTFDFGGAPVTPGDTIAFTQLFEILGDNGAQLFYDAGAGPCPGVFGTEGTVPPLGTAANRSAGVTITQRDLVGSNQPCLASDTALCLDGVPGDNRYQVTATFNTVQGGGRSGQAQATHLRQLGTVHGGLLWFFSPDNPELLVKIVNGCAVNDRYWVYASAGTNVGFTLTVNDTLLAVGKTYTNPDLKEALPIQDTQALASCHTCSDSNPCRAGLLCCSFTFGNTCVAPTAGGVCPAFP
jgi:hypothetical protein